MILFPGNVGWNDVQLVMEILLGCRTFTVINCDGVRVRTLYHDTQLAPLAWKSRNSYPSFSNTSDLMVETHLKDEIPTEGADLILETLMGVEYLKQVKLNGNLDIRRRMLVAQWMYTYGVLDKVFPPTEPAVHNEDGDDSDWD